jgi:hypothetical protein
MLESFEGGFSGASTAYLELALGLSREPMKAEVCLGPPEAAVGAPVKAEDRRLGVPGDSDLWNKDIVNTNSNYN